MTINCPECRSALELPDMAIGRKVQCPFCKVKFIGEIDSQKITSGSSEKLQSYLMAYEEKDKKGYCDCNITDVFNRDDVVARISRYRVPIIVGIDDEGNVQMCDLADPENDAGSSNIIVAGRTGTGKSVFAKYNVASLLLKSCKDVEVYVWDSQGLDFNRRFFRVPGVTIFEGDDEFDSSLSILKKLVAFRSERVANAQCRTLDEYNKQNPDDVMSHVVFVLDGCNFAASSGKGVGEIEYFVRNTLVSGVHLIAMAQTWSCNGKALKSVANLFGRKLAFGSLPDVIRGAFIADKAFFKIAAQCSSGHAVYDDGAGTVMEVRTPFIVHQDFHRVGEWKARMGVL